MAATAQVSDRRAASGNRRAGIALTIIVTCQLMVVLDSTVVNIAITQIHASLHFSTAGLSWVINAYTLTFGGLMLLGGRAGDIFGRRRMLVAGLVVFSAASLVGGLAISPAMLVASRAVQGVGAAMAAPSTLALIAATFEEGPPRNKALAVFSAVSAGGGSLGLILGGVLTAEVSWRWVLFINVPIGLAVVVLAPRFVPEPPRREGRLDLPGALLSTAGLALLIYSFIRIGEGSSSIGIITGLFAAAVTLLSLFVVVEARSSTPLMPLHLILDRTRGLVLLVMLSISAVVFGMFFFISQYAQTGLHYSALRTGLAFLPLTVAIFALSRIMPRVLARTGPRLPLLCGTALIAISLAWLSRTSVSQGYLGGLFGPLLLFGIGIGLSYVPMGATILKGVDRDDSGSASGIYQAMQQIGGSVGLAILVSIAAGHGQSAALEGAAGFAVLAFVLTAVALSGQADRGGVSIGIRAASPMTSRTPSVLAKGRDSDPGSFRADGGQQRRRFACGHNGEAGEHTGPMAQFGEASSAVDGSCEVAGRRVDYCLYGPASGPPVVFEYGTPGTRRLSGQLIRAAARAGVQLLVLDRPGYGTSTRLGGRQIVDVVDDIAAVVDAIGWEEFAVWGGSGGAPHALACAATLSHRVIACASVVGPAPFDAFGLDWFGGMSPGNVEEFMLAARGEQAYRPLVQRLAEEAVAAVAAGGIQVAADYQLSDSDLRALQARRGEGDYLDRMRITYTGGVDGWIDDCMAMTRPWGFELEAISVPVSVWYGPDDVLSPRAHAEYLLAAIPGAVRFELEGGHVLGDADLDAIYNFLTHT